MGWVHWSGITPALGERPRELLRRLLDAARRNNIVVSCDLNFRSRLWSSVEASRTLTPLMESVDLCIGNEEDARLALGLRVDRSDDPAVVVNAMRTRFGFAAAAMSVRESHSATRNGWSGVLATAEGVAHSESRDLDGIVDRFGAGDAFAAGLIHALRVGMSPQDAIDFAAAAGALKHTIPGDFLLATIAEIEQLVCGDASGRVRR